MLRIFNIIVKFIRPNFTILSIKKLKKVGTVGFWLEDTKKLSSDPSIVEYKYNSKRLKYFSTCLDWPPLFKQRLRPISKVKYYEEDITDNVKVFSGPRQCEIHPISFFPITKRFRIKWRLTGVTIGWFDFVELREVDPQKLVIYRS